MFYRLKPKIIQKETVTIFPNDEYEPIKLKPCLKSPGRMGGCQEWNNGEGSEKCCGCVFASWETEGV